MRKTRHALKVMMLLLVLAASAPSVCAGQNEIEAGTLVTNYVWRGLRLSDGPVYQASVTVGAKGFDFNAWGNYDFKDGRLNEIDLTFSYSREIGKVTVTTGYTRYSLIKDQDSDELYAGLWSDIPLQPELMLYCNIYEGTGAFLQGSIGHSIPLGARASLDLKASIGAVFQNSYMGRPDSGEKFNGFHNAEILVECPMRIKKRWTLNMVFGASTPLGSLARQAIRNASVWDLENDSFSGTILYGGVSILYAF